MEIELLKQAIEAIKDAQWRINALSKSKDPMAHRLDGPVLRKLIYSQIALTKLLENLK